MLFAPTHPPYLGNPRYPGRNAEMFEKLLACPVRLTVRHIGSLEENGLWEVPGVTYTRGDMGDAPGMLAQIDAADCVVADRSTFGNLSVARGATTVLWDTHLVFNNEGTRHPDNLDRYRDLLHHPFDADDGDMWDLIRAAAADTARMARARAVHRRAAGRHGRDRRDPRDLITPRRAAQARRSTRPSHRRPAGSPRRWRQTPRAARRTRASTARPRRRAARPAPRCR